jgi:protein-L-isoaspartate(D-aspartate) O-methyltransferase
VTPDQQPGYADEAEIRVMIDRYADELKAAGAIESAAVERAFRTVERHRLLETFYYRGGEGFVTLRHDPGRPQRDHLALIYADTALVTRQVGGLPASSTSQASLVARMLELLDLSRGMKVLEVGAGTGYNAALMAEIVGDQRLVTTVDVLADVVEQTRRLLAAAGYPGIRVVLGDGFDGFPEEAPFDRIVGTVGCSDLSPRWAGQLAGEGAMLIPLEHAGGHPLVLVRRDRGGLRGRFVQWTGFIPARGLLRIKDLWVVGTVVADPAEVVHELAPRPLFADGEDKDFLLFLALNDHRACGTMDGAGLSDGRDGWAAAGRDGITWWKDGALARELRRRYQEWDALGRPGMVDYQLLFVPVEEGYRLPPGGWQIERRFYRELVSTVPPRCGLAGSPLRHRAGSTPYVRDKNDLDFQRLRA